MTNGMRLMIGLVILPLASCAAKSSVSARVGTQARVGSVIRHLEPTSVVRPALPEAARVQGIVGPVLVEVRISEAGDVSVLSVVRGHRLLDDLAKTAVEQWKYPPTVFEGRTIPVIAIAVVSFVQGDGLDEQDDPGTDGRPGDSKSEVMLIPALLTLLLADIVQADLPFEVALWPGEGRPVIESVASELVVREQPFGSAKTVLTLATAPGQRLQFDETRFRTTRPGQLQAVVATTVTGRRLGAIRELSRADYYSGKFPDATVRLNAGDAVEYLQYRAEGTCFVRIADVVFDAKACPLENRAGFRLVTEPAVEWWVRLVSNGRPIGWLLLTDKTAKVVDREF